MTTLVLQRKLVSYVVHEPASQSPVFQFHVGNRELASFLSFPLQRMNRPGSEASIEPSFIYLVLQGAPSLGITVCAFSV